MEFPPIIVAPVDPECRLTKEACLELENRIRAADMGSVIVCPMPVNIYHWIDGLWILSEDLADFHAPPQQAEKREPQESNFVPPTD